MMKQIKKLSYFLVVVLLISGCGGTVQRNLTMYPAPEMPNINVTSSTSDVVSISGKDFSSLTEYVIKLGGQLDKCNSQSKEFNE